MANIDRLPRLGARAAYLKHVRNKRIDHENFDRTYGEDIPEVHDWKWRGPGHGRNGHALTRNRGRQRLK